MLSIWHERGQKRFHLPRQLPSLWNKTKKERGKDESPRLSLHMMNESHLFHCHRLREVAWLIDILSLCGSDMISEQLEGND